MSMTSSMTSLVSTDIFCVRSTSGIMERSRSGSLTSLERLADLMIVFPASSECDIRFVSVTSPVTSRSDEAAGRAVGSARAPLTIKLGCVDLSTVCVFVCVYVCARMYVHMCVHVHVT